MQKVPSRKAEYMPGEFFVYFFSIWIKKAKVKVK